MSHFRNCAKASCGVVRGHDSEWGEVSVLKCSAIMPTDMEWWKSAGDSGRPVIISIFILLMTTLPALATLVDQEIQAVPHYYIYIPCWQYFISFTSPSTHTYFLLVMDNDIPPTLDCRRVTLELTERLCSQQHVRDGINDLLKFSHSEDSEFQRYGRKVLFLLLIPFDTQLMIWPFPEDYRPDRG